MIEFLLFSLALLWLLVLWPAPKPTQPPAREVDQWNPDDTWNEGAD